MKQYDYDGATYELSMTRAGAAEAEDQGLRASEIADKPFRSVYLLMFAALYSRYKVSPAKANAITEHILSSGQATLESLIEELSEQYAALFSSGGSEE